MNYLHEAKEHYEMVKRLVKQHEYFFFFKTHEKHVESREISQFDLGDIDVRTFEPKYSGHLLKFKGN